MYMSFSYHAHTVTSTLIENEVFILHFIDYINVLCFALVPELSAKVRISIENQFLALGLPLKRTKESSHSQLIHNQLDFNGKIWHLEQH